MAQSRRKMSWFVQRWTVNIRAVAKQQRVSYEYPYNGFSRSARPFQQSVNCDKALLQPSVHAS
jgi:hypothetical protein